MRARSMGGILAVVCCLTGSAYAIDAPAPVEPVTPAAAVEPAEAADAIDLEDACELNYTPADPAEATDELAAGAGCKSCKDRPWCGCRYNGLPRVSCNPCCYGNLGIPQICYD